MLTMGILIWDNKKTGGQVKHAIGYVTVRAER